ncbi:MAG: type II toxin-antitoxin system VapB family antitoxin [Prevotellaceae bacterium]|nr:type II toxin-antitoxin system VapB family antitoxin [Prevotellaceae bacterium]
MYSIELDEQLIKKAMSVSGKKTQQDTVLAALHDFIKAHNRRKILDYQGKGIWEGDLDEMRAAR